MRQAFVFSASLILAGVGYTHLAAALPIAGSSIARTLAVGEERPQQVHVRRYRHRHHAYRRYRGYPYGFYPYTYSYAPSIYVPFGFGHHGGYYGGHHFGGHHGGHHGSHH